MKVRDRRSNCKVRFGEIPVGTTFYLPTGLWIKVKPFIPTEAIVKSSEHVMNVVRLEDGLFAGASDGEIVSPVNLEIEIHDYNPERERLEGRDEE